MLRRRDLLLGIPLLGAAGGAFALKPRKSLQLLGDRELEDVVPKRIGSWQVTPSNAFILPEAREGSLAATLYNQQLTRLYTADGAIPVMLVIAYGSTQSDLLQLHRPEVCYRAVGFTIDRFERVDVPVGGATVPMRALTARANERTEPILYWTRIGDMLPTSNNEQRLMKLQTEMAGYVADGVLVRLSTVAEPSPAVFDALEAFAVALLTSMSGPPLEALVGRPTARAIKQT